MFSGSQVCGGSMFSVASVDSTVAYLINRVQRENCDVRPRLQGFDLVVVNLQGQFPHNRTFSGARKGLFLRCYEDHLFEEFAKRRSDLIGIFDDRPINTQSVFLETKKKAKREIPDQIAELCNFGFISDVYRVGRFGFNE
jgi:hypothetical protein